MDLRRFSMILLLSVISAEIFAQSPQIVQKEKELIALYNKISSHPNDEQVVSYSEKFEQRFIQLIKNNPQTLSYSSKKLSNNKACYITTSDDGMFRIYSWDDGTGGTMRYFKSIIQWKANNKVFSDVVGEKSDIFNHFCSKIYVIKTANVPTYFAITNSIGSTKDVSQAINAYRISGSQLTTPKIFKAKSKTLSFINVDFDFFSVVDRPERPLALINYDQSKRTIFIPFVNQKGNVENKALVYQLQSNGYFEYTGISPYKYN